MTEPHVEEPVAAPAAVVPPAAPAIAAPAAPATPVEAEDVTLNLDTLERPDAPPPFRFRHGDKNYLLSDPEEVDWQELLLTMRNPVRFFRVVLPADQVEGFLTTRMPGWKMEALMKNYNEHYKLDEKIADKPQLPF